MMIVAAVAAYVASVVPGCLPDRVMATTRFTAGENHAVYRVLYLDADDVERKVVVRVSNADSEAARARASREVAVLERVGGHSGPRLLDFQAHGPIAGTPVMCMEHVEGAHESLDAASAERLSDLGRVVRQTHELPVQDLADVLNGPRDLSGYVNGRLQSMLDRMSLIRDPLPLPVQTQCADQAMWARQTAGTLHAPEDPGALRLLHGDVSPGNVLWTPQPVLIDWEYARLGDPADEIGYLFGQNDLRPDQRQSFWRGYSQDLDAASRSRIVERAAQWEPLTLFGSALYWIDLWLRRVTADAHGHADPSAPKEPAYYLGFATRYLDRCDQIRQRPNT
jgi:aminoglycoside phosphotransferase (APT) family kinase protein